MASLRKTEPDKHKEELMQHRLKADLKGKHIAARDGAIGSVVDTYFDDAHWAVRYLVVDTGDWLPGKKVLLSPTSVAAEQTDKKTISVALSRQQVRDSPGVNADMPVSRQFEEAHALYYGYPFYWTGPYLWGGAQHPITGGEPVTLSPEGKSNRERLGELRQAEQQARESHLRSTEEVTGYRVVAKDGPIGHVEDFVMDEPGWEIVGIVIDTRDWLPGKHVRIARDEVESIDWVTRELRLRATRDEVRNAPKAS